MVTINSAESNRASLRIIKESTWATTPASGVTKELRYTASSLVAEKETVSSDEIRADRMVSAIVEVGASTGGDINGEFSAGTWDDFYEAFVLGAWSRTMNGFFVAKGVVVTDATTLTITGYGDLTDRFTAGDFVKLEGAALPANNIYVAITSVTASTLVFPASTWTIPEANSGNSTLKLMDAQDVIDQDTAITLGQTTTGETIDGTFTTQVSAGELRVGQKIHLEGLNYGTEDVVFATAAAVDGETVTISDGTNTVTFEFDDDSTVTAGNIAVDPGALFTDSADNFAEAVMLQLAAGKLRCSAVNAAGTVTVTNYYDAAGSLAEAGTNITVGAAVFSGYDALNHGFKTITAVDNSSITVAEGVTDNTNVGGATVVIKGAHLRNDGDLTGIIKQSFTIETGFTDIARYFLFRGQRVGSFSQSVTAGEIITVDFTVMGNEIVTGVADTLGDDGTYTVLPTTDSEPFNATSNVGTIRKNGTELSSALMSIEITGEANLREQKAVSSKYAAGIGYGRFNLSGSMEAYFETFDLYDDFLQHNTISLDWYFSDLNETTYYFTIPALKITSDPVSPEGIDQDVMENMDWEAFRDSQLNTQFMIDAFSSLVPATAG